MIGLAAFHQWRQLMKMLGTLARLVCSAVLAWFAHSAICLLWNICVASSRHQRDPLPSKLALILPLICISATVAFAQNPAPTVLRTMQEQVQWKPNPAMPDGVQTAVLYGDPSKSGLYAIQVRFPPATRLPVHSHPDERLRTILSGTYYSAVGQTFDAGRLEAFPPGTLSHVPTRVWQFAETRAEAVIFQIIGIGPTGIDYLNPEDDPRQRKR
jgi:hypothetical protein